MSTLTSRLHQGSNLSSFLSAIPVLVFLHISPLNGIPNAITSGSLFLFNYLTFTPFTGAITHTDLENLKLILSRIKILWPPNRTSVNLRG